MKHFCVIHRKANPLTKEKDYGNIEYKWKLVNIKTNKKRKLITQMNYRLREGNGKCIYAIGFKDSGKSIGITYKELDETIFNLIDSINEICADIYKLIIFIDNNLYCAKIFINKKIDYNDIF